MTEDWKEVQRSHSEVGKVHSWQKGQPLQSPKAGTWQVCLRNSKEESVAEQSDKKNQKGKAEEEAEMKHQFI